MSINELLDLFRRLPSHRVADNLADLLECLDPDTQDELLSSVDQPLKVLQDGSGRDFLACDFNRDSDPDAETAEDAFRSPWTNEYTPSLPDGTRPSQRLRVLEQAANDAFSIYREQYYEGSGISSVYLWDVEDGAGTASASGGSGSSSSSFAGVVLLKKQVGDSASWDSIHVFEVAERSRVGSYKLTSTIMLYMNRPRSSSSSTAGTFDLGTVELGGSMTRQLEQSLPLDPLPSSAPPTTHNTSHISNLGRLIEEQEIKMRNLLQEVYFAKTRDVVNDLRSLRGNKEEGARKGLQGELVGLLRGKRAE